MPDLEQLIRASRPEQQDVPRLDLDRLRGRARQRHRRRVATTALAVIALAGTLGLVVPQLANPPGVEIDDLVGEVDTDTPPLIDESPGGAFSGDDVRLLRALRDATRAAEAARDQLQEAIGALERELEALSADAADARRRDLQEMLAERRGQLADVEERLARLEAQHGEMTNRAARTARLTTAARQRAERVLEAVVPGRLVLVDSETRPAAGSGELTLVYEHEGDGELEIRWEQINPNPLAEALSPPGATREAESLPDGSRVTLITTETYRLGLVQAPEDGEVWTLTSRGPTPLEMTDVRDILAALRAAA